VKFLLCLLVTPALFAQAPVEVAPKTSSPYLKGVAGCVLNQKTLVGWKKDGSVGNAADYKYTGTEILIHGVRFMPSSAATIDGKVVKVRCEVVREQATEETFAALKDFLNAELSPMKGVCIEDKAKGYPVRSRTFTWGIRPDIQLSTYMDSSFVKGSEPPTMERVQHVIVTWYYPDSDSVEGWINGAVLKAATKPKGKR